MTDAHAELPAYTEDHIRERLFDAGASGTIYALVMLAGEDALQRVVDGCDALELMRAGGSLADLVERRQDYLAAFREPWTRAQDMEHVPYFERWFEWSKPVVSIDEREFPYRYPTAGASEGIFKLMAEEAVKSRSAGMNPAIHVFEGEYEGFGAYARANGMRVFHHPRSAWRTLDLREPGQFWISQPSAIDGAVWPHFDEFCRLQQERNAGLIEIVPDLSYVGAVAREYHVDLRHPNIRSVVISSSKPFGGYYHRCGGVLAKRERPSLFANVWFKNITSLRWGAEMLSRHDVFDLPRLHRPFQERAAGTIGRALGIRDLEAADVMVIGTAPVPDHPDEVVETLVRGCEGERRLRLCLTPAMTVLADPTLAPHMTERLRAAGTLA